MRLQVRQMMSGQWFFALVSLFWRSSRRSSTWSPRWLILREVPVSAGTIVAFTTVQARLMFPLIGLMRVALDLQTSARAVRSHLRVPRPDARHHRPCGCPADLGGPVPHRAGRVRERQLLLPGRRWAGGADAEGGLVPHRAGRVRGLCRPIRSGQDHHLVPDPAVLRGHPGQRAVRGRRRARTAAGVAALAASASSVRRPTCSTRQSPRTSATPSPRRPTPNWRRLRARRTSTTRLRRSRMATRRWWGSAATG